jgi:serine/threonine protein kinase
MVMVDPPPLSGPAIPILGAVLGETYRVDRLLARGGCGDVYVATHLRLGSEVAVKLLLPSLAGNVQALARLQREADIMSTVRHPHIVQILDFDVTEQGVPFLVMELLEGWPLTGSSVSGPPFEARAAVHIVGQIGQALAAAHAHGIVHLDLKPDNVVLVRTDGRGDFVKVIDFGISQAIWRERLATDPLIAGTPEYMAPEQAGGMTQEIDHRADQFSLAGLSYRILTGHEPFSGDHPFAILHQVINETPQPPSKRVPWLGEGVDAVIQRGMAKRPTERYPDVMGFADALRAAVELIAPDRRRVRHPRSRPASVQPAPPLTLAERDTLGVFQPKKTATVGRLSGVALFVLCAAAFIWFSPSTRTMARRTWYGATAYARRALVALGAGSGREP